ncbi:MAG: pilus assembly protein PilM [Desulfobacterales bacterium]
MFKLKDKLPIGIDIGNHHIYAAQLKRTKSGLTTRALWHRETQEDIANLLEEDKLVPHFKAISTNKQFQGKRVVIKLPPQNIFSFPAQLKVAEGETVEETILRKSAEHLTFPIEDAILDYPSLTPEADGKSYKATIVAVSREDINRYVRIIKKAGLLVEAVDFDVSSLIRLHKHLFETITNIAILCNVGHTQTLLTMATEESILGQRSIPWGERGLTDKILSNIELQNDRNKARTLLKMHGIVHEDRTGVKGEEAEDHDTIGMRRVLYQILTPLIDEFVFEFHRMVSYARSEEENPFFEGIYMYGQAALIKHLDAYMESRVGIQTLQVDPLRNEVFASEEGDVPYSPDNAPFAMALGLAMRNLPWL